MAKKKLTKTEKKELNDLMASCLDDDGEPLPEASTDDLIRLAELQEKNSGGQIKGPGKPQKATREKMSSSKDNQTVQDLISQGYKYLGTDGQVSYFYGPKSSPGAFRLGNQGLECVGMRFSEKLLNRLTK